jgi:uncharacterized membrane protein
MIGRTAERVGFFTDAIFAIAMTLLVIEIPRPGAADLEVGDGVTKTQAIGHLWHFLVDQRSDFFAYALAFSLLWIVWREHYVIFGQVSHVSGAMISWHFPLLLLAAFLPYATTVMGHYPGNPLAALLLGLVVGALLACRSAIQSRAARDNALTLRIGARDHRAEVTVSWVVTWYWLLTLMLVWWTPWVEILWFLTPAVGTAGRMLSRRSVPAEDQGTIAVMARLVDSRLP